MRRMRLRITRTLGVLLTYATAVPRLPGVVLALVALLRCAHADEYRNVSLGAVADFQFSSTSGGIALLGEGGAEYVGIRSFRDKRLLVQWDTLLAVRGGIIGNTLPYTSLVGGHTLADVEAGYRFMRTRSSLYAGGKLAGDLSIMAHPGLSLSQLDRLNDIDGVGGVVAHGELRADIGWSWIAGRRSLLLVAFAQEVGYAPGVYTPGLGYTEGGVAARFDLSRRLTAYVEGFGGRGSTRHDDALATSVQSSTAGVDGVVRGIFGNGIWLAVSAHYQRQFDRRTYRASPIAYETANAPDLGAQLLLGIPFEWKHRSPVR